MAELEQYEIALVSRRWTQIRPIILPTLSGTNVPCVISSHCTRDVTIWIAIIF